MRVRREIITESVAAFSVSPAGCGTCCLLLLLMLLTSRHLQMLVTMVTRDNIIKKAFLTTSPSSAK